MILKTYPDLENLLKVNLDVLKLTGIPIDTSLGCKPSPGELLRLDGKSATFMFKNKSNGRVYMRGKIRIEDIGYSEFCSGDCCTTYIIKFFPNRWRNR